MCEVEEMGAQRWCVLAATLAFAGCSLGLTGVDPERPRNQPPECDRTKGFVYADGVLGALSGAITLGVAIDTPSASLIPLALAAVFIGSAIHGNAVVDACRDDNREYYAALPTDAAPPPRESREDHLIRRRPASVPVRATVPTSPTELERPAPPPTPTEPTTEPPAPKPTKPPPAAPPPPKPTPAAPAPADEPWGDFWRVLP
ncbi:MAG: hypothetical protein NT062_24200 [Proteobacteria bacterium]|nr:hypothetical protein [Pseudomonadota bacterium]